MSWKSALVASTAARGQPAEIEEIVVTAELREATAQRTPPAITAISAEHLEQQGVRTAVDLTVMMRIDNVNCQWFNGAAKRSHTVVRRLPFGGRRSFFPEWR